MLVAERSDFQLGNLGLSGIVSRWDQRAFRFDQIISRCKEVYSYEPARPGQTTEADGPAGRQIAPAVRSERPWETGRRNAKLSVDSIPQSSCKQLQLHSMGR